MTTELSIVDLITQNLQFVVGGVFGFAAALYLKRADIVKSAIIDERKNWREKIRDLAKEVAESQHNRDESKLMVAYYSLQTRLNPKDAEDIAILNCLSAMTSLRSADEFEAKKEETISRISFLLKHDWERAKREANMVNLTPCGPIRGRYTRSSVKLGESTQP